MSLYHPRIQIHASRIRGGLDAIKYSTADPASTVRLRLSSWTPALILRLREWALRWSFRWRATILASMRLWVSGDIHAWRLRSRQGVPGMSRRSSENTQSNLSGIARFLMGKRVRFPS